jgi:hypothetical protein
VWRSGTRFAQLAALAKCDAKSVLDVSILGRRTRTLIAPPCRLAHGCRDTPRLHPYPNRARRPLRSRSCHPLSRVTNDRLGLQRHRGECDRSPRRSQRRSLVHSRQTLHLLLRCAEARHHRDGSRASTGAPVVAAGARSRTLNSRNSDLPAIKASGYSRPNVVSRCDISCAGV